MGYKLINNLKNGFFDNIKCCYYSFSFYESLKRKNINVEDYWILKKTGNFKLLEKHEYEKYAGVIGFKKDLFKKEDIELWIYKIYKELNMSMPYLSKPFPPIEMLNKIKVVQWDI